MCADTDPAAAARALVKGRFSSGNGQICCAVKRVFVQRPIYDAVARRVLAKPAALTVGDPLDDATDVGPLISEERAAEVEQQVTQAVSEGAKLAPGAGGALLAPTMLTDVPADSTVFGEEIFGPVLPLVPFDDHRGRPRDGQRQPYGLQAALFTRDIARACSLSASSTSALW